MKHKQEILGCLSFAIVIGIVYSHLRDLNRTRHFDLCDPWQRLTAIGGNWEVHRLSCR